MSVSDGSQPSLPEVTMTSIMRRPALVLAALALLASGGACGKEAGDGPGPKSPDDLPRLTAAEFYGDYSTLTGAELFSKYKDGVIVKGQVKKQVNLGKDEGWQLWLTVDGPGHIAARFQDAGATLRQRKLKVGDEAVIRCQIRGKPEAILFLASCILE
jgi:hypothetical protein